MTAGQIRGFELHPQPDLLAAMEMFALCKACYVSGCEWVSVCVCEREGGSACIDNNRKIGRRAQDQNLRP